MNEIICICKKYIETNSLEHLQEYVASIVDTTTDWTYIFQKVYLHACLKGREDISTWLQSMFTKMEPIQQIALRQIFPYGRHLLAVAKNRRSVV